MALGVSMEVCCGLVGSGWDGGGAEAPIFVITCGSALWWMDSGPPCGLPPTFPRLGSSQAPAFGCEPLGFLKRCQTLHASALYFTFLGKPYVTPAAEKELVQRFGTWH